MKPFNLEEAKAGKPIVNTFSSKIKFIAFEPSLEQPLICAVNGCLSQFNADGQYFSNRPSQHDLFMAPTKREGWVNIFKCDRLIPGYAAFTSQAFKTKELADKQSNPNGRIACVPIKWEE